MDAIERTLRAIDMMWPELPRLVGEGWERLEDPLCLLLLRLRAAVEPGPTGQERADRPPGPGPEPKPDPKVLLLEILDLVRAYPAVETRLQQLMAEADAHRAATRGWLPRADLPSVVGTLVTRVLRQAIPCYAEVTCPRMILLADSRVAVVVRLTSAWSDASAVPEALRVTPGEVSIRIDAPAFQILGEAVQTVTVEADRDSTPAVFFLRPNEAGPTRVTVDFLRDGNPVGGTVSVAVQVLEAESVARPDRTPRLDAPARIGAGAEPDVTPEAGPGKSEAPPSACNATRAASPRGEVPAEGGTHDPFRRSITIGHLPPLPPDLRRGPVVHRGHRGAARAGRPHSGGHVAPDHLFGVRHRHRRAGRAPVRFPPGWRPGAPVCAPHADE